MNNLPTEANQNSCLTCPFCKGFASVQIQQVQRHGLNEILWLCARIATREVLGHT